MDLLQTILRDVKIETDAFKQQTDLDSLKSSVKNDNIPLRPFSQALTSGIGLIAEIKRQSPSMGKMTAFLNGKGDDIHRIYDKHPVVKAISVLTNKTHFDGTPARFKAIRQETTKPMLRKDFIYEPYQIWHSRAMGADAILLMANVVTDPQEFQDLHALATELGMAVLCEIHTEKELTIVESCAKIIGVNCRRFKQSNEDAQRLATQSQQTRIDASVDISHFELINHVPNSFIKIAESGINANNINDALSIAPFQAALVGTSILQHSEGAQVALDAFSDQLK